MWLLPRFSKPRDNNSSITDNAILEAQYRGKTEAICDSGSAFNNALQGCNKCIDLDNDGSSRSAIESALAPYLEFCKATYTTTPLASIDASWLTMRTTLIPTTLNAPDSIGGESYVQTLYKPATALSTLPGYFFHLSVGSIVSSYIPASIFSQLASSVSLSAGAASVTGDPTSLIYAAFEATSVPSWFSAAVPATYSSQMHTLQEEINQLRATPISPAIVPTSSPTSSNPVSQTSLASSSPSAASETQGSKAWIAGPVVGGIAAISLFTLGVFIYQRRRRRRAAGRPELEGDTFQMTGDKPQLHSDHLPPRYLYEMDASQAPSEADDGALPEMAANEAPARELAADPDHHRSRAPVGGKDVAHLKGSAEEREICPNAQDVVETRP